MDESWTVLTYLIFKISIKFSAKMERRGRTHLYLASALYLDAASYGCL